MGELRGARGAVLPLTLFLLTCTLLWGSVLVLTLSDAYAASDGLVAREQSRLLAYSGWNLALQQLDADGGKDPLQLAQPAGTVQVSLQDGEQGLVYIEAEAVSHGWRSRVTGAVRVWTLPWQAVDAWPVIADLEELQEAGLLLTGERIYRLDTHCQAPLAISQREGLPLTVQVTAPLTADILYIHGDLLVEAPLCAEAVYVSGQIYGAAQIDSAHLAERYATVPSYRIQVVERRL